MSRRDKDRKDSLAALGRIAERAGSGPVLGGRQAPPPVARPIAPKPAPRPSPAPPPSPLPPSDAERARRTKLRERQEKLEEERTLRERRAQELARGRNLEWRGMDIRGVPASIRRTGFDKTEPSLHQKIDDVLGAAKEKEGRAKNRDKGRRQGGK